MSANGRTSERVHRDKHSSDVSIDLSVLPSFLKILVDAFITDSRE